MAGSFRSIDLNNCSCKRGTPLSQQLLNHQIIFSREKHRGCTVLTSFGSRSPSLLSLCHFSGLVPLLSIKKITIGFSNARPDKVDMWAFYHLLTFHKRSADTLKSGPSLTNGTTSEEEMIGWGLQHTWNIKNFVHVIVMDSVTPPFYFLYDRKLKSKKSSNTELSTCQEQWVYL